MSQRQFGFAVLWVGLLCVALVSRAGWAQEAPAPEAPPSDAAPAQDNSPAPQDPPSPPAEPAPQPSPAPATETPAPTAQEPAPADPAPAEPAAAPAAAATQPAMDPAQARAEYEARFLEWKEMLKYLRTLKHEYQLADEAKRSEMEKQWQVELDKTAAFLPTLVTAAVNAYRAAPNEDRELANFLMKVLEDDINSDKYDQAAQIADVMLEGQSELPAIYRAAGIAHFALNNLDRTLSILQQAEKMSALSSDARALRSEVTKYVDYWKREQELRAKEAAADDLPRVKLTTTKGDIVLELFENEAPETVGNFINLVEKGFYKDLTFHRVIAGFMAQGGCPEGDGTSGPGYSIYDECGKPDARMHFRGSVSMAKTEAPNSGGSQFFICFRPAPNLNGIHTVFGRVLEGQDVVDRIQRREPKDADVAADKILQAEVLRKRDHEYLPHKVE